MWCAQICLPCSSPKSCSSFWRQAAVLQRGEKEREERGFPRSHHMWDGLFFGYIQGRWCQGHVEPWIMFLKHLTARMWWGAIGTLLCTYRCRTSSRCSCLCIGLDWSLRGQAAQTHRQRGPGRESRVWVLMHVLFVAKTLPKPNWHCPNVKVSWVNGWSKMPAQNRWSNETDETDEHFGMTSDPAVLDGWEWKATSLACLEFWMELWDSPKVPFYLPSSSIERMGKMSG